MVFDMTLLVLSDSHGQRDNIEKAIQRAARPEAILFLGDGLRDIDSVFTEFPVFSVRGNCDFFGASSFDEPDERILRFGEYTVMMMHGHTHSVKSGPERAIAYAASKGADILLYGHTHTRHEQYIQKGTTVLGATLKKPIWVLNPGSIGSSYDGYSFGTVTIRQKSVLLGFGTL